MFPAIVLESDISVLKNITYSFVFFKSFMKHFSGQLNIDIILDRYFEDSFVLTGYMGT